MAYLIYLKARVTQISAAARYESRKYLFRYPSSYIASIKNEEIAVSKKYNTLSIYYLISINRLKSGGKYMCHSSLH